jgi:hypothetical protein
MLFDELLCAANDWVLEVLFSFNFIHSSEKMLLSYLNYCRLKMRPFGGTIPP